MASLDPAVHLDKAQASLAQARMWMNEMGSTISPSTVLGHVKKAKDELEAAMVLIEMLGR